MQRLAYIPPLGNTGASSMTQAGQLALAGRSVSAMPGAPRARRASSRKRRRKASSRPTMRRRARRASSRRGARRLVKGSAAAKRFMARLRAKRRRK